MFGLNVTKSIQFIYQIKYYTCHTLHNYYYFFFFSLCVNMCIYVFTIYHIWYIFLSYFALFFFLLT